MKHARPLLLALSLAACAGAPEREARDPVAVVDVSTIESSSTPGVEPDDAWTAQPIGSAFTMTIVTTHGGQPHFSGRYSFTLERREPDHVWLRYDGDVGLMGTPRQRAPMNLGPTTTDEWVTLGLPAGTFRCLHRQANLPELGAVIEVWEDPALPFPVRSIDTRGSVTTTTELVAVSRPARS